MHQKNTKNTAKSIQLICNLSYVQVWKLDGIISLLKRATEPHHKKENAIHSKSIFRFTKGAIEQWKRVTIDLIWFASLVNCFIVIGIGISIVILWKANTIFYFDTGKYKAKRKWNENTPSELKAVFLHIMQCAKRAYIGFHIILSSLSLPLSPPPPQCQFPIHLIIPFILLGRHQVLLLCREILHSKAIFPM